MSEQKAAVPFELDEHKKELFKGAVDLHIHTDPSFMQRTADAISCASEAASVGMRAVCYKDHHLGTVQEAWLANKYYKRIDTPFAKTETPFTAYGSYCMNNSQGGYDPYTLETALRFGAKQIYGPTVSSGNQHPMEHTAAQGKDAGSFMPMKLKPISEFELSVYENGVDGEVSSRLKDCLALIRDYDVIFSTGHLSYDDSYAVVKVAKEMGCKKLLLTHFDVLRTSLTYTEPYTKRSLEELGEVQKAGDCFVEYCISNKLYGLHAKDANPYHEVPDEYRSACLRYFGPDLIVHGTDNGSSFYPRIVEEYALIFDDLIKFGFSDADIRKMTSTNACALLGISVTEQDIIPGIND